MSKSEAVLEAAERWFDHFRNENESLVECAERHIAQQKKFPPHSIGNATVDNHLNLCLAVAEYVKERAEDTRR